MPTGPKRHHQVPRFYLERFAVDGRVAVRWRDGKTYDANPINVAVESGFYDIPDGAGGVSKEIEGGLADVEGMADGVLRDIDQTGHLPSPTDPASAVLALFVGLQMARTTEHRERVLFPRRVVDWASGRPITPALVADFLETEYIGFKPEAREVDGAFTLVTVAQQDARTLTDEFAVEMMLRAAWELSRRLLGFNWSIEFDRRNEFITSDTPVVMWRKPTPRDHFEGFGIETAEEVRLPLDPGKQIIMSRRARTAAIDVAVHRVRRCNLDMAGACHRFVVGSPLQRAQVDRQRLARWRPLLRFDVGPGVEVGPDGTERPMPGEIVHMWTPRAAGFGPPARPD